MVLDMNWISVNSVYIGCKETIIFIHAYVTTQDGVVLTLLEGIVSVIHCPFEKN